MKFPKRLKKNPIVDAIAEIRFSSDIPAEAIVGLVYSQIKDEFGSPENLPILQLPLQIRESDPQLRYQACYKFSRKGQLLLLGPRNVALSIQQYENWAATEPLLVELITKLDQVSLFKEIERVGLRYVNFFESTNVIENSTLTVSIAEKSIASDTITLRSEKSLDDFKVITQLANVAFVEGSPTRQGSIIDIDIINEKITAKKDGRSKELMQIFAKANELADEAFFSLLKPEFLKKFEPEY